MEWIVAKDVMAASMLALVLLGHRSYIMRGQMTARMIVPLFAFAALTLVAIVVDPIVSLLDPAKGVRIALYIAGGGAVIVMGIWFWIGVRSRSSE